MFFGAWKVFPVVTGLALWGALIIGAVYMTRAIRNVLHGPVPEKWSQLTDATDVWRRLPYALLLASLLAFGFFPKLLTDQIEPDAKKIVQSLQFSVSSVQPPKNAALKTESLKLETASTDNPQSGIRN